MMKILFCTNFFENTHNGAGAFARTVYRLNEFPGCELRVLTEDYSGISGKDNIYRVSVRTPPGLSPLSLFLRTFYYHRAASRIRRHYAYDVLFYNNAFTAFRSAMVTGKKYMVAGFIHDYSLLSVSLRHVQFERKWLARFLYRQVERWACRMLDVVFVNSGFLSGLALTGYGVQAARINVSVDVKSIPFNPERPWEEGQTVHILFVKNNFILGGLEDLLQALGRCPSIPFRLTVMGPFMEEKAEVLRLAPPESPNLEIDFLGNVDRQKVFEAMQTHHLLCVPSRCEAMGLANVEGLAHGIPVIATTVGGIPEVMDHGRNGWLCRPGDPRDLAETIARCLRSEAERERKSRAGRAYVERHYDQARMLAAIREILEKSWRER